MRSRKIASKKAKPDTRKIVDRITYNPKKHKNKKTRELRQKLQQKSLQSNVPKESSTTLKFGSLNVNGLGLEAGWAVEQLLENKGFDVRFLIIDSINISIVL